MDKSGMVVGGAIGAAMVIAIIVVLFAFPPESIKTTQIVIQLQIRPNSINQIVVDNSDTEFEKTINCETNKIEGDHDNLPIGIEVRTINNMSLTVNNCKDLVKKHDIQITLEPHIVLGIKFAATESKPSPNTRKFRLLLKKSSEDVIKYIEQCIKQTVEKETNLRFIRIIEQVYEIPRTVIYQNPYIKLVESLRAYATDPINNLPDYTRFFTTKTSFSGIKDLINSDLIDSVSLEKSDKDPKYIFYIRHSKSGKSNNNTIRDGTLDRNLDNDKYIILCKLKKDPNTNTWIEFSKTRLPTQVEPQTKPGKLNPIKSPRLYKNIHARLYKKIHEQLKIMKENRDAEYYLYDFDNKKIIEFSEVDNAIEKRIAVNLSKVKFTPIDLSNVAHRKLNEEMKPNQETTETLELYNEINKDKKSIASKIIESGLSVEFQKNVFTSLVGYFKTKHAEVEADADAEARTEKLFLEKEVPKTWKGLISDNPMSPADKATAHMFGGFIKKKTKKKKHSRKKTKKKKQSSKTTKKKKQSSKTTKKKKKPIKINTTKKTTNKTTKKKKSKKLK
jgi:hypothetical protein